MASAQSCPAPTGLSKDSVSGGQVHFSWNAIWGATSYLVEYTTVHGTSRNQVVPPGTSFTFASNPGFEILTVRTLCPSGDTSEASSLIIGGIVVTVDDIFTISDPNQEGCGSATPAYEDFLMFSDLCQIIEFPSFCDVTVVVTDGLGAPVTEEDSSVWLEAVVLGMENYSYPWDACEDMGERRAAPLIDQLSGAPNPFSESFTLNLDIAEAANISVQVFDLLGREIARRDAGLLQAGSHHLKGWGRDWQPGVYFIQIKDGRQTRTLRVLKI